MGNRIFAGATLAFAIATGLSTNASSNVEVVPSSQLKFIPLNPARGDASPQAGVLWGDIRKDVPSGILLRFAKGFASPPHIHNITYRAVVISGALHNDDPNAERMWMGPGSFWTQPAGENHITAAPSNGGATAFLEILEGPYLVQPSKEAFDNGEFPINMAASNITWLNANDVTWVDKTATAQQTDSVQVAYLWGQPRAGEKNGTFLKLPSRFEGTLKSGAAVLRAVVISGDVQHQHSENTDPIKLRTGSYFGSKSQAQHLLTCESNNGCIIYVRTEGRYTITGR